MNQIRFTAKREILLLTRLPSNITAVYVHDILMLCHRHLISGVHLPPIQAQKGKRMRIYEEKRRSGVLGNGQKRNANFSFNNPEGKIDRSTCTIILYVVDLWDGESELLCVHRNAKSLGTVLLRSPCERVLVGR